jgi:hypothetical protein
MLHPCRQAHLLFLESAAIFFALSSIGVSRWYKTHGILTCCNMSKTELAASTVFVNTIVRFGAMSESWIPLLRPHFTASRRASTCVSAVTSIHLRSNLHTWCTIIKCRGSMVGLLGAHSFRLRRVWRRVWSLCFLYTQHFSAFLQAVV